MQHKGASECDSRTATWAGDEFCDFELLDYDSFGGKSSGTPGGSSMQVIALFVDRDELPVTRLPEQSNFLRYALKKGLQQQAELGVNSFKYGLIGSTDTHIAAPGLVMERNFPGHGGAGKGSGDGTPAAFPDDLVERLAGALEQADADVAMAATLEDGQMRAQPVFTLLKTSLLESLVAYLHRGERKIAGWTRQHRCVEVPFEDSSAFFNASSAASLRW